MAKFSKGDKVKITERPFWYIDNYGDKRYFDERMYSDGPKQGETYTVARTRKSRYGSGLDVYLDTDLGYFVSEECLTKVSDNGREFNPTLRKNQAKRAGKLAATIVRNLGTLLPGEVTNARLAEWVNTATAEQKDLIVNLTPGWTGDAPSVDTWAMVDGFLEGYDVS